MTLAMPPSGSFTVASYVFMAHSPRLCLLAGQLELGRVGHGLDGVVQFPADYRLGYHLDYLGKRRKVRQ